MDEIDHMEERILHEELASLISSIVSVARTGLAWTKDKSLYEYERYERIIELAAEAAELVSQGGEGPSATLASELRLGWLAQVTPGAAGYVTPKISTGAVCFDDEGRLLLGKRGDSGLWFIPTGWLEVGLTPAQNVIKEVREETGIECRPVRIIGVRDTRYNRQTIANPALALNPHAIHNIALTFLCEALSSEFRLHPLETQEAGFFTEEEALRLVPERASLIIEQGFAARRGELPEIYFDLPPTLS